MRAIILITFLLMNSMSRAEESTTTKPAAEVPTTTPAATASQAATPTAASIDAADEEDVAPKREPVQSGWLLNPGITLASRKLDDNNQPQAKLRAVNFDTRLGYMHKNGFMVGIQLNYSLLSSGQTSADTDTSSYLLGPMVGYHCNITGLFLTGAYFTNGSQDVPKQGKYSSVSGYQIDLGYPMKVSDNVKIGPQLTMRNIKLESGSGGLADTKLRELTPYFGLWLYF